MKPNDYRLFYCFRCGWGLCAFPNSDMYQQYEKSHQQPNCPYCKRRVRGFRISTSEKPFILNLEIREPARLRKPISKKQREEILKKYGGKCVICGSKENLEIDHIIPVIFNGKDDADNLQVLCKPCNASKGESGSISEKRERVIELINCIKQSCSHLTSEKRVSMAEIARVSGVSYSAVLRHQDAIRRELGLSKKGINSHKNAPIEA